MVQPSRGSSARCGWQLPSAPCRVLDMRNRNDLTASRQRTLEPEGAAEHRLPRPASSVPGPAGALQGGEAERAWAAVLARDGAWDGRFVYAVASTGIFCRPS